MKLKIIAFFLILLFFIIVLSFSEIEYFGVENYKVKPNEKSNDMKIKVVALCTPNYREIAKQGLIDLPAYCKKHGYAFELYEEKLLEDLHINFTKMEMMRRATLDNDYDYTVLSDMDIDIPEPDISLEKVIDKHMRDMAIGMPRDFFGVLRLGKNFSIAHNRNSLYNAGFIIAKNSPEASEIFEKWIEAARGACKEKAKKAPVNQGVFDTCVYPLYSEKIALIPWQIGGLQQSRLIRQNLSSKNRKRKRKVQLDRDW